MKFFKIIAPLFLVLMVCSAFVPKDKKKNEHMGVYMAGVSASFTDSIIYFTDIQYMDSIVLGKDKLLPSRKQYSEQLEDYFQYKLGMENRTCFIYFDLKKGNVEKTLKQMKDKYKKSGNVILKETGADFKFTKAVEY